jgi:hypothetical protein
MNDYQPKCHSCVDGYRSECHCQKSVFFGMDLDNIPWEGCTCFLSQRKWSVCDKPKKKRKKKWPSMAEFEFGV